MSRAKKVREKLNKSKTGECLVFDEKAEYKLTFISKSLKTSDKNVTKKDVLWFCDCLLNARNVKPRKDFEISKNQLMDYIYHSIPELNRYKIYDSKIKGFDFKGEDILYASFFQGGVNRKYLMQFYYNPLKVLEFKDIVKNHTDFLDVKYKKLQELRKKLQNDVKRYG